MDGWRPRLGQAFDPLALELSVDEAYLLSLVDGQTSMDELCQRSGQSQADVVAVLQRLIALGVVDGSDAPADLGGAFDLKASLALEGLFDEPGAAADAGLEAIDDEDDDLDVDLAAEAASVDLEPGLALDTDAAALDTWDDVTSADNPVHPGPGEAEAFDGLDLDSGFDGPSDPTEVGDGDELARLLEAPAVEPLAGSVGTASPTALTPDREPEPADWDDDSLTPLQTDLGTLGIDVGPATGSGTALAGDQLEVDALEMDALPIDGAVGEVAAPRDVAADAVAVETQAAADAEAWTDDELTPAGFELPPAIDPEAEGRPTPSPSRRHVPRSLVAQPGDDDDDDDDDDDLEGGPVSRPRSEGAWSGRSGAVATYGPEEDPEIVALPSGNPEASRELADRVAIRGQGSAMSVAVDDELAALLASVEGDSPGAGGDPTNPPPPAAEADAASAVAASVDPASCLDGAPAESTVLLLDAEVGDVEDELGVESGPAGAAAQDDEEIVVMLALDGVDEQDDEEIVVVPPAGRGAVDRVDDGASDPAAELANLYEEGPLLPPGPAEDDDHAAPMIELDPNRHRPLPDPGEASAPSAAGARPTPPVEALDPPVELEGVVGADDDLAALVAALSARDLDAGVRAAQAPHARPDRPPERSLAPDAPGEAPPGASKAVKELPASALLPIEDDDPPFPPLEIATQALSPGALVCFDDLRTMHLAERFNLVRTAEGDMFSALCLDPNPRVICELIAQPTFEVAHACLVARWQQSPDTLRELKLQGSTLQDPKVQAALLDNPHAPPQMLAPLMDIMAPAQLYHLCAREDLPHETRVSAAYALREAYALLAPQERVDLILGTEGACLLLAGLPLDEDTCDLLAGHKFESKVLAGNLAQYPTTPLQVLQRLYMQPVVQDNLDIKTLIRQHPNWPS